MKFLAIVAIFQQVYLNNHQIEFPGDINSALVLLFYCYVLGYLPLYVCLMIGAHHWCFLETFSYRIKAKIKNTNIYGTFLSY